MRYVSLKYALNNEDVCSVKVIDITPSNRGRLFCTDKNKKLVCITNMYDIEKMQKRVSRWLFKDFPIGK